MSERLIAARCGSCGAGVLFFINRRALLADEDVRCPVCAASSAPLRMPPSAAFAVALRLALIESGLRRAVDPDEPDSGQERLAGVRRLADSLRKLADELIPPSGHEATDG